MIALLLVTCGAFGLLGCWAAGLLVGLLGCIGFVVLLRCWAVGAAARRARQHQHRLGQPALPAAWKKAVKGTGAVLGLMYAVAGQKQIVVATCSPMRPWVKSQIGYPPVNSRFNPTTQIGSLK